ncbi:MAG: MazG nucleotide pyrophosphohydrolase domain-containing protein [Anaeromassilibacillus sp.]
MDDLLEIMKILRAPGGCPWDREQTHQSIRNCFIEETYESVESIYTEDPVLLQEELGDVLLQVLFHSEIEEEEAGSISPMWWTGSEKDGGTPSARVYSVTVDGTEDAHQLGRDQEEDKGAKTQTEVLQSVSKALPALMRSQKVQQKAAKVGFDWPDVSGALDKVEEETAELREQSAQGDACAEELGTCSSRSSMWLPSRQRRTIPQ